MKYISENNMIYKILKKMHEKLSGEEVKETDYKSTKAFMYCTTANDSLVTNILTQYGKIYQKYASIQSGIDEFQFDCNEERYIVIENQIIANGIAIELSRERLQIIGVIGATTGTLQTVTDAGNTTTNAMIITGLNIQQLADNSGIQVNGYNTQSSAWLKMNLDSGGYGQFDSSNGFRFKNNGTNIAYINGTDTDGFRMYDNVALSFGTTGATRYSIGYNSSTGNLDLAYGGGFLTAANVKLSIKNNGNVGIGTTSPNASALLDLTSTTKAFLPPRMTTVQKAAISSPTAGDIVYDTTLNKLSVYTGATWETITSV